MTQEYTPTTDEVCECWTTRGDIGNPYETDADVEERHHEESVKFDCWLAAHDTQIRADAWEEGRIAEHDEAYGWGDAINPYRKEQK